MSQLIAETASQIDRFSRENPRAPTDVARAERKRISASLKTATPEEVTELALQLVQRSDFWHRYFAYEIVANHKAAFATLTEEEVEALGDGIASWADVDTYACYVAGVAWRTGIISDAKVQSWTCSADRWWRRAALVSTVPLNMKSHGGKGDATRTLDICERLAADRDDMVVKALSWALRCLAGPCRAELESWHGENRGKLAARVNREVDNKLRTGLKNPRPSF